MSKTYTFTTLTSVPIQYSSTDSIPVSKVVIPSIQRAYAQGRKTARETKIRNGFLKSIFEHLMGNTLMDLHFIYGAVSEYKEQGVDKYQLELLDGQQRFTTLFLLHWYLLNREHACMDSFKIKEIQDALHAFIYKTRTTTTEFCKSLVDYSCELDTVVPSDVITKAKWYYQRYDKDSSIQGMLVMLDAIHDKYNECCDNTGHRLVYRTRLLQFYVLPLVDYKMAEELYIKMNERGLPLSPFDNFKADFTGAMLKSVEQGNDYLNKTIDLPDATRMTHREDISVKLDTKWIDIYWKPGEIDYYISYMRFFSRFFAYRFLLDSGIRGRAMQDTSLPINVFYTLSENVEYRNDYLGFDKYASILKIHPEYFKMIEKVLDTLHDSNNMLVIHNMLRPIWEKHVQGNFFVNADVPFSQSRLVVFGSICDFIILFPTFDEKLFRQWMRVVWNVVENTNIDSLSAATGPMLNLNKIITEVADATPVTINDFYTAISKVKLTGGSAAVREEIEKASRIADDEQWLAELIDSEKHPYLKGAIGFFNDPSLTLSQFIHNRDLVKTMFDSSGIAPEYRHEHVLIRAIISHLKTWDDKGLEGRYITEEADTNKRLKLLLLGNEDVRLMFVDVLNRSNNCVDIKRELNQVIYDNTIASYYGMPNEVLRVAIAHNVLTNDIKLYDWMATQSSPVCVGWYKGHIAVAVPRLRFDRYIIDSERDQMALSLMKSRWYYREDKANHTSIQDYYRYGHFKGENLKLYALMKDDISFNVDFINEHHVNIYLKCLDEQQCIDVQNKIAGSVPGATVGREEKDRLYIDVLSSGNPPYVFDYYLNLSFPTKEIEDLFDKIDSVI